MFKKQFHKGGVVSVLEGEDVPIILRSGPSMVPRDFGRRKLEDTNKEIIICHGQEKL